MPVYVAKNLKKRTTVIDGKGHILSVTAHETKEEEMKRKQEERARKLGFLK